MFQVGKLAVTGMVATFGTASIAANSVGYTVIDFANIPGNAMGLALITVVGQCVGAGEKEQAKSYTKRLVKYAYFGDWICNICLFLLAGVISRCFNLSVEAQQIAVQVLHAFSVTSMFIWPLSFTLPNALRAAGDVNFTMTVSIVSMWIFRVGSSYLFGVMLGMGVIGVWIGMFIDWAARSLMFVWRFFGGKWLNRRSIA
jgi:Na+-driven multidrug efflux pump